MATGANITLTDDLRQKLEALAGTEKTDDDLANEAVALSIRQQEGNRDWRDLVSFGRRNGAESGYTESDVVDLVRQVRQH